MRFSVIVPVYNVAEYLPECMESLLEQSFQDFEIILVDDGSTDGSGRRCDEYQNASPDRVRVIHRQNGGLGAARNTGMDASRGDYLLFVDSDDYVSRDTLACLSAQIDRTGADMYVFGYFWLYDTRTVPGQESRLAGMEPFALKDHPEMLMEQPSAWRRVCRRELYLEHGFRFPDRAWYEDLRTTVKMLTKCRSIVVLPDRLYLYRQRDGSIMRSANLRRNLEIIEALEDLRLYFEQQELMDTYGPWLCALAIEHLLMAATVRVAKADPGSELLGELRSYMDTRFPQWKDNPYVGQQNILRKFALYLIEHRHYRLLGWLFRMKG